MLGSQKLSAQNSQIAWKMKFHAPTTFKLTSVDIPSYDITTEHCHAIWIVFKIKITNLGSCPSKDFLHRISKHHIFTISPYIVTNQKLFTCGTPSTYTKQYWNNIQNQRECQSQQCDRLGLQKCSVQNSQIAWKMIFHAPTTLKLSSSDTIPSYHCTAKHFCAIWIDFNIKFTQLGSGPSKDSLHRSCQNIS